MEPLFFLFLSEIICGILTLESPQNIYVKNLIKNKHCLLKMTMSSFFIFLYIYFLF